MHASLHKSRRENHRRVVSTQQDTIYSRAHLVLTNSLITSLLVLCFSRWFLLFLPPNILLISCHPRLLFWYLLFRYRWAHHLCFLSMNDLSRSSFFDCPFSTVLPLLLLSVFFPYLGGILIEIKQIFPVPFPMMTHKRKFIPHHSSRGSPRSAAARSDDEAGCRFSKQEDVLAIHCQPRLVTGRKIRLKENGKDIRCDICRNNFSGKSADRKSVV